MDKFCILTGASYSVDYSDMIRGSFELMTNDHKIMQLFTNSVNKNFNGLQIADQEFMCIWCQSPNPIINRHCSQCGAPRGFVIR